MTSHRSDEPDYRLRIAIWGLNSTIPPRIEYLPPDAHDAAIFRAWELSRTDQEPISRLQVIDAFGMLIAQFTHRKVFMGEHKFKEWTGNRGQESNM
jgi:hypothetical protein